MPNLQRHFSYVVTREYSDVESIDPCTRGTVCQTATAVDSSYRGTAIIVTDQKASYGPCSYTN